MIKLLICLFICLVVVQCQNVNRGVWPGAFLPPSIPSSGGSGRGRPVMPMMPANKQGRNMFGNNLWPWLMAAEGGESEMMPWLYMMMSQ